MAVIKKDKKEILVEAIHPPPIILIFMVSLIWILNIKTVHPKIFQSEQEAVFTETD